jgi:hypothetical protein
MVLVGLAAGTAAQAANAPHPTFDALATEVAGHSTQVWCEDDPYDWDQLWYPQGVPGGYIQGFAPYGGNVVFVSPTICEALWATVDPGGPGGYLDSGMSFFARALLVLIHEAEHAKGIVNEAEAECAALPLVVPMAVKHFGVPQTIKQARVVSKWKKVGKKRVRVQVVQQVSVANPDLTRIAQWAKYWHDVLPAEYRGTC